MIPLGVLASAHSAPAGGPSFVYYAGITPQISNPWIFENVPLGVGDANRLVVVTVTARDAPTSEVSIGGVAAVELIEASSKGQYSAIYAATVPTGTTANISVTNSNKIRLSIGVWVFSGLGSITNVGTASATTNDGIATLTGTQSGDYVIAVTNVLTSASTILATWTGAIEEQVHGPYAQMWISEAIAVATGADHQISAAWSSVWIGPALAAAAFRPA